ncbi:hypothetical protein [Streptomyces albus]|uniref:hypothetical protein n=1 Tax=Streptomyces albus TaxID=1888 RepID=UPI0024E10C68|nr:hypothetical protein [Streptomyces albus]GHJ18391.1 hypothetical protein TPA0909_00050 [Streptomyces albus]
MSASPENLPQSDDDERPPLLRRHLSRRRLVAGCAAALVVAVAGGLLLDLGPEPGDHPPMPLCAGADNVSLIADVDGDGQRDEVRDPRRNGTITVVFRDGDERSEVGLDKARGFWEKLRDAVREDMATRGTVGDFDGDGYVDLALFHSQRDTGDNPSDNMAAPRGAVRAPRPRPDRQPPGTIRIARQELRRAGARDRHGPRRARRTPGVPSPMATGSSWDSPAARRRAGWTMGEGRLPEDAEEEWWQGEPALWQDFAPCDA